MTMNPDIRKPRAFAPDDAALRAATEPATGAPGQRESTLASRRSRHAARTSVRPTVADLSRGIRWGGILLSSLIGLLALSTTLWFTRYIEVAVDRNDWVGWLSFSLLCLVGLSVLVILLRELIGLFRLARLGRLRHEVKEALKDRDLTRERRAVSHLTDILSSRADLSWPPAFRTAPSCSEKRASGQERSARS